MCSTQIPPRGRVDVAGAGFVIRRLQELDGLRPGLTPEEATDTYFALASPELYLMLVQDRGWTPDAYEAWLRTQLERTLLGPA